MQGAIVGGYPEVRRPDHLSDSLTVHQSDHLILSLGWFSALLVEQSLTPPAER